MRSIDIDFDIHQLIEANRRSFEEAPNTVLRRLFDLPPDPSPSGNPTTSSSAGTPWRADGIELPHGTDVFMTYGRGSQRISGRIENGEWMVGGRRFKSPSGAASQSAKKPDGSHPSLDGFKYWQVRLPGSTEWVPIETLRIKTATIVDRSGRSADELGL